MHSLVLPLHVANYKIDGTGNCALKHFTIFGRAARIKLFIDKQNYIFQEETST